MEVVPPKQGTELTNSELHGKLRKQRLNSSFGGREFESTLYYHPPALNMLRVLLRPVQVVCQTRPRSDSPLTVVRVLLELPKSRPGSKLMTLQASKEVERWLVAGLISLKQAAAKEAARVRKRLHWRRVASCRSVRQEG